MKRICKVAFCLVMACAMVLTAAGCAEWVPEGSAPQKSAGYGLAIGEGNSNCIAEATVIVDGFGNPTRVMLDEIFSPNDLGVAASNVTEPTVSVQIGWGPASSLYQYIKIGDLYFEMDVAAKAYKQIGGDGVITNLSEYALTETGM